MDEFLTPNEIADLLKVNKQTILNWVHEGKLPGIKIGGLIRITRSDFEEVIQTAREGPSHHASFYSDICQHRDKEGTDPTDAVYAASRVIRWARDDELTTKWGKNTFIIRGNQFIQFSSGIVYVTHSGYLRFRWAQSGNDIFEKADKRDSLIERSEKMLGIDVGHFYESGGESETFVQIPIEKFANDQTFEGLKELFHWFLDQVRGETLVAG